MIMLNTNRVKLEEIYIFLINQTPRPPAALLGSPWKHLGKAGTP